jgi:hypothetical protein
VIGLKGCNKIVTKSLNLANIEEKLPDKDAQNWKKKNNRTRTKQ